MQTGSHLLPDKRKRAHPAPQVSTESFSFRNDVCRQRKQGVFSSAKRTYKNVTLEGPVAGGKTSLKQPTRETCSACETCWQSTAAPSLT